MNKYNTCLCFLSLISTCFMIYTIDINHLSWNRNIYQASQRFTLIGQFNYPSKFYSKWSEIWSKFTKDIVMSIPENITHPNYNTVGKRIFGRFVKYQGDKGYTSPYMNMARVIRENNHSMGYLYIHDDMMISGSIFKKLGGSEWIMAKDHSYLNHVTKTKGNKYPVENTKFTKYPIQSKTFLCSLSMEYWADESRCHPDAIKYIKQYSRHKKELAAR